MDPKVLKELTKKLTEVSQLYMDAANSACGDGVHRDLYGVYFLVRDHMATQTKIRNLERRYGNRNN